ncbi:MAG: flagellar biosynthetic protein FliO [Spirochaetes bacterium]|nr:flagellar biosynthetic protein FliO [Spirochaetota bacterium]
MSFILHKENKTITAFFAVFIFFVFFIVLCPIKNSGCAEEGVSENKKITENRNKNTDNKKSEEDVSLYDYERPTIEEDSYGWLIFKTVIVLGLLVGGFYYFFRFVTKKTGMHLVGRDVIKILSIVPVGQNKFLQVIDLAGRIMVIAVSDSNISLITEIQDKDEIDRIRLLSSKSSPVQPGGFQEYISRYISKLFGDKNRDNKPGNFENKYEDTSIDRINYLRKQRARLKKINGNEDEI